MKESAIRPRSVHRTLSIRPQNWSLQTGRARWNRRTSPAVAWWSKTATRFIFFSCWHRINGLVSNKTSISPPSIHPAIYFIDSHLSISYLKKTIVVSIFCFKLSNIISNTFQKTKKSPNTPPKKNKKSCPTTKINGKPTRKTPTAKGPNLTESSCSWYLGDKFVRGKVTRRFAKAKIKQNIGIKVIQKCQQIKKMPVLFFIKFGLIGFLGGSGVAPQKTAFDGEGFGWFPSLSSYQGRDLFIPRSLGRSPTTFEFGIPKKVIKNCQAVILQTDLCVCVWFIFAYFVAVWLMCALTFKKLESRPGFEN